MKVKLLKDVWSQAGWRREGEIVDLEGKELNHYLRVNIAEQWDGKSPSKKEDKSAKETKEDKKSKKRSSKKSK